MSSENEVANMVAADAYYKMVNLVAASVGYGLSLPLSIAGLQVLHRRKRLAKSSMFLFPLLYAMLICTTGIFITSVGKCIAMMAFARQDPSDPSIASFKTRWTDAKASSGVWSIPLHIFYSYNFVLGDAVVVWRACQLYPEYRSIRWGLWLLLCTGFVITTWDVVEDLLTLLESDLQNHSEEIVRAADSAALFVSLAVNTAATIVIIIRSWRFRRQLKTLSQLSMTRRSLPYQILVILIEFGALYCILQIINAVIHYLDDRDSGSELAAEALFSVAYRNLAGFVAGSYPALLVLIIAYQQSVIEDSTGTIIVGRITSGPVTGEAGRSSGSKEREEHFSTLRFATGVTSGSKVTTQTGNPVRSSADSSKEGECVPEAAGKS